MKIFLALVLTACGFDSHLKTIGSSGGSGAVGTGATTTPGDSPLLRVLCGAQDNERFTCACPPVDTNLTAYVANGYDCELASIATPGASGCQPFAASIAASDDGLVHVVNIDGEPLRTPSPISLR